MRAFSLRDMPFMLFNILYISYLYPTESITWILFQISIFVQLNLGEVSEAVYGYRHQNL